MDILKFPKSPTSSNDVHNILKTIIPETEERITDGDDIMDDAEDDDTSSDSGWDSVDIDIVTSVTRAPFGRRLAHIVHRETHLSATAYGYENLDFPSLSGVSQEDSNSTNTLDNVSKKRLNYGSDKHSSGTKRKHKQKSNHGYNGANYGQELDGHSEQEYPFPSSMPVKRGGRIAWAQPPTDQIAPQTSAASLAASAVGSSKRAESRPTNSCHFCSNSSSSSHACGCCVRLTCSLCTRRCEKCLQRFCSLCTRPNFRLANDRILCHPCDAEDQAAA